MKKRIAFRKLNRTSAHKWSMLRNMVSSLIEHERIVTTEAKAKELRHLADQMITLAKKGLPSEEQHNNNSNNSDGTTKPETKTPGELLHHRRRASRVVRGEWNVTKLFDVLGPRYKFREGGYTRVLKLARPRAGDNAPMAVIEYVDRPGEIRAARPPSVLTATAAAANDDSATGMNGIEDALRKMGIAPAEELVSEEELQSIEEELNNENKK
mmetsp:Transcript_2458/g.5715  ORF Transcript_2458/g.5715 Transcript_2458/m.5715 type:complete len:212 (+) Transcript_2458:255-890(+)